MKKELQEYGYALLPDLFSGTEVDQMLATIENAEQQGSAFLRTTDLFAIRQLMKTIPELAALVFTPRLTELISGFYASNFFLTKAIYFDKPGQSNWFVGYHQDLSISVNQKINLNNYTNWTYKKGQHGVQPPTQILEDTLTVRIHLDDTDEHNGALKVIPGSHQNGIIRPESTNRNLENEHVCKIKKGGVLLMKPLTLHASGRTTNGKKRRVIHLEFNNHQLAKPLQWLEKHEIESTHGNL